MKAIAAALAAVLAAGCALAEDRWPAVYPEGPIWISETLYWAEMQANKVMRLGPNGPEVAADLPGCGPTSIAPFGAGMAVLCHFQGAVVEVDPTGNTHRTFARAQDGTALRNPNDSYADEDGGLWFTDPGRFSARVPAEGRLYRLTADGRIQRHDDGLAYGNGVYLDAPSGRLLVSEHLARRVLAYPLTADGLGAPEVLVDLNTLPIAQPTYPEAGPDGLERAPDGTLWIAEYGAGRLLGWREGEGLVAVLKVPLIFVTNIAFGPDGRVAVTGSVENHTARNRGEVLLLDAQTLRAAELN